MHYEEIVDWYREVLQLPTTTDGKPKMAFAMTHQNTITTFMKRFLISKYSHYKIELITVLQMFSTKHFKYSHIIKLKTF